MTNRDERATSSKKLLARPNKPNADAPRLLHRKFDLFIYDILLALLALKNVPERFSEGRPIRPWCSFAENKVEILYRCTWDF